MSTTLFILNEAPYGSEHVYNALRLAGALSTREGQYVQVFLMGDAVIAAKTGQTVPACFYNVDVMLGKVLRNGCVALCGTCMDARGTGDGEMISGTTRSTLAQLTDWTVAADKVLVF